MLSLLKKFPVRVFFYIFISLVASYISVSFGSIMASFFETVFVNDINALKSSFVTAILWLVIYLVTNIINEYSLAELVQKIHAYLKVELYQKIMEQDNFKKNGYMDYFNDLNGKLDIVVSQYFEVFLTAIPRLACILIAIILILKINLKFALILSIIIIVSYAVPNMVKNEIIKRQSAVVSMMNAHSKQLNNLLSKLDFIRLENEENRFKKEYQFTNSEYEKKLYEQNQLNAIIQACNVGLNVLATIVLVGYGAILYLNHEISLGNIVELSYFVSHASGLVGVVVSTKKALEGTKTIVAEFKRLLANKKESKMKIEAINELALNNISLAYDKSIFDKFNYCFDLSKKYVVIGDNGSGKSTLLDILVNNNTAYDGEVLVNGVNLKNIDDIVLRKHVLLLNQNTYIFEGSIKENIILDQPFNKEKFMRVLKQSHCEHLIERLDTKITHNGSNLSGGEKQKLALARALYRDFDVLLLDEFFKGIDTQSKLELHDLIINLDKGIIQVEHSLKEDELSKYDFVINLG
ncbi:MAG: ABC transporter ATP-binding protein [Erysipelotrichales bacterium]|nr:ABC transporter ATP-binding protein [Erysipelotrichales bacterium]